MHRLTAVLLLAALSIAPPGPLTAKVASHWMPLPPVPTPRQEVGVAELDRKIYVIGGILGNRGATGAVERFDVDTEKWEQVRPLPGDTRLHHVGAAAALGKVFAVGGLNSSFRGVRSVFAFDPSTGEWSRVRDMPWPRGAMGVAAIEDRIYVAGGQDGGTSFADAAVYIAAKNRWESLPDMPTARNHLAAASIDGVFYAVGGRAGRLFDALEAYDPATKRWARLAPMPTARAGIAAAALEGMLFVFGGEGNSQDPRGIFRETEGYDVCRNIWLSDIDMENPRHGIGAAALDFAIYIPGGSPVQGFGVTDVHDAYVPGTIDGFLVFLRGDSNLDDSVDISDAVFILISLFVSQEPLPCDDGADANDDGAINITDAVFILNFLFQGGPPPPHPGPDVPDIDLTPDELDCSGPRRPCFAPF